MPICAQCKKYSTACTCEPSDNEWLIVEQEKTPNSKVNPPRKEKNIKKKQLNTGAKGGGGGGAVSPRSNSPNSEKWQKIDHVAPLNLTKVSFMNRHIEKHSELLLLINLHNAFRMALIEYRRNNSTTSKCSPDKEFQNINMLSNYFNARTKDFTLANDLELVQRLFTKMLELYTSALITPHKNNLFLSFFLNAFYHKDNQAEGAWGRIILLGTGIPQVHDFTVNNPRVNHARAKMFEFIIDGSFKSATLQIIDPDQQYIARK